MQTDELILLPLASFQGIVFHVTHFGSWNPWISFESYETDKVPDVQLWIL